MSVFLCWSRVYNEGVPPEIQDEDRATAMMKKLANQLMGE